MSLSVAVAGASGYAGGELLRLLAQHPDVEITTVTAFQNAGQPLIATQPHLRSLAHFTLQETTPEVLSGADVVFLALPHGKSGEITAELPDDVVVIDCGADHRLTDPAAWGEYYGGDYFGAWDYGLPELILDNGSSRQRSNLVGSTRIAVPGCNVTAITLGPRPRHRRGRHRVAQTSSSVLAVGHVGSGQVPQDRAPRERARWARRTRTRWAASTGTRPRSSRICRARRAAVGVSVSFTPVLVPMSARHPRHLDGAKVAPGVTEGTRCVTRGRPPTPHETVRARAARRAVPAHPADTLGRQHVPSWGSPSTRRAGRVVVVISATRQPRQGDRGRRDPVGEHRARVPRDDSAFPRTESPRERQRWNQRDRHRASPDSTPSGVHRRTQGERRPRPRPGRQPRPPAPTRQSSSRATGRKPTRSSGRQQVIADGDGLRDRAQLGRGELLHGGAGLPGHALHRGGRGRGSSASPRETCSCARRGSSATSCRVDKVTRGGGSGRRRIALGDQRRDGSPASGHHDHRLDSPSAASRGGDARGLHVSAAWRREPACSRPASRPCSSSSPPTPCCSSRRSSTSALRAGPLA